MCIRHAEKSIGYSVVLKHERNLMNFKELRHEYIVHFHHKFGHNVVSIIAYIMTKFGCKSYE